jgi:adenosine deaminase
VKAACVGQAAGPELPSAKCQALLKSSERTAEQWELERRFAAFEASLP